MLVTKYNRYWFCGNDEEWKDEIKLRLNKVDEVHDFSWALRQMKAGEKVAHDNSGLRFFIKNNIIYYHTNYAEHVLVDSDYKFYCTCNSRTWYIWKAPKVTLSKLKPGQKFKLIPVTSDSLTLKMLSNVHNSSSNKYCYIWDSILFGTDKDEEVELVNE